MSASLYLVAPRLALARDQHEAIAAAAAEQERWLADRLLHKQRLVAHRELQLARAQATGRRGYISERWRKLDEARAELEQVRARVAA
jgi:hypothetical protein